MQRGFSMRRRGDMVHAGSVALDEKHSYTFGIGASQPEIFYDPESVNNHEYNSRSWLPEPIAQWTDFHGMYDSWTQYPSIPILMAQPHLPHFGHTIEYATATHPPLYCWEPLMAVEAEKFASSQPYQGPFGYEVDSPFNAPSPPLSTQQEYINPILDETNFFQVYEKQENLTQLVIRGRSPVSTISDRDHSNDGLAGLAEATPPSTTSFGFSLDWSLSSPVFAEDCLSAESLVDVSAPKKRKQTSPAPCSKKPRQKSPTPDPGISNFVVVFENAPGALSTVKHRKKLDAPVRKAARAVRKVGACHHCRFRKRTCSTGTPCNSCVKSGNGLHELRCQRESPFSGKTISEYFEFSSTRRCVSFNIPIQTSTTSSSYSSVPPVEWIEVDGIGTVSMPIRLRATRKTLGSFGCEEMELINRTRTPRRFSTATLPSNTSVFILITNPNVSADIEAWAISYTSKFIHAAGPQFESTTMAYILGTAWVAKRLPEHELVASMIKVASLSFVLRAGVKYTSSSSSAPQTQTQHRTIEASIDTLLYNSLRAAERTLFTHLQRLIFRTAGTLSRSQIYPIALVLFQLLRLSCLASSHLTNISQRFPHRRHFVDREAEHQLFMMKLVLSTHLALFRNSIPLLIDVGMERERDLVGGDGEVVELARRMRGVVMAFREGRARREMKGSLAFRREYFEMFRCVYDGL